MLGPVVICAGVCLLSLECSNVAQVILKQLEVASDENLKLSMHKKMAPPLITLLGGESELQYVALRNISLIVQKYPQLLSQEVKVFFCKYNDPIYVKMVGSRPSLPWWRLLPI